MFIVQYLLLFIYNTTQKSQMKSRSLWIRYLKTKQQETASSCKVYSLTREDRQKLGDLGVHPSLSIGHGFFLLYITCSFDFCSQQNKLCSQLHQCLATGCFTDINNVQRKIYQVLFYYYIKKCCLCDCRKFNTLCTTSRALGRRKQ